MSTQYKEHFEEGFYCCAHCGARLFSSTEKFQATGRYPAFRKPIARSFVQLHEDYSYGTPRKTASCANVQLHSWQRAAGTASD
jgi:peptide methionine sulfoxide reductase MsrB